MLTQLERVELEMASLYEWFSEVFAADEDASGLFFRMSLQEHSHARLLRWGRRLVVRSPAEFEEVDFDPSATGAALDSIAVFRAANPQPELGRALLFAMKIECHPAENGHREVLTASNPELNGLIQSLAVADQEHHRTLRDFAQRRAAEIG